MAIIFPDQGEPTLLDLLTPYLAAYDCGLFQAAAVPVDQDITLADLTECDFKGYARQGLTSFAAASEVNHKAKSIGTQVTFDYNSAGAGASSNDALGYFWTNGTVLIAIRVFDTPITMSEDGDRIKIKTNPTLNSEA